MKSNLSELAMLSAVEIRERVVTGALSPYEAAQACLERISSTDREIGSFVTIDEAQVRKAADDVSRRLSGVRICHWPEFHMLLRT